MFSGDFVRLGKEIYTGITQFRKSFNTIKIESKADGKEVLDLFYYEKTYYFKNRKIFKIS